MKCRHCGAQLQELLLATDPIHKAPSTPSRPFSVASAANVFLYCVIVGCGAICGFAAMIPGRQPSHNYYKPSQSDVAYQTTATNLYQNYSTYEAAAKLTTGNLAIQISGTVKSIGHNLFDETEVYLDAGGDSRTVTVTLDGSIGATHAPAAGTKVSVHCENMTRILGPPIGQSCQLVR
jgi:hypothetical protein